MHPDALRLEAYFDGELGALEAAELERHVEGCDECRAHLQGLERASASLRSAFSATGAPPALRDRLARALDQEGRVPAARRISHPFWAGALAGACAAASAGVIAIFFWTPLFSGALVDDLVGAHLRSLMPEHLIDVVSTDRHTVKPWFAGHADVSPAVEDFGSQGYQLIGGRADYVERQRAAVLVYRHGAHVINVFSWAGGQRVLPDSAARSGYQLVCWKSADLDYCAISDTAPEVLRSLARLLQQAAGGPG